MKSEEAARLKAEAQENDLAGAALAWVETTMSCIECHKWARDNLIAEEQSWRFCDAAFAMRRFRESRLLPTAARSSEITGTVLLPDACMQREDGFVSSPVDYLRRVSAPA